MEALFQEVREKTTPMLHAEKYFGKVGAFQGADLRGQGALPPRGGLHHVQPQPEVVLHGLRRAIERVIRMYAE